MNREKVKERGGLGCGLKFLARRGGLLSWALVVALVVLSASLFFNQNDLAHIAAVFPLAIAVWVWDAGLVALLAGLKTPLGGGTLATGAWVIYGYSESVKVPRGAINFLPAIIVATVPVVFIVVALVWALVRWIIRL